MKFQELGGISINQEFAWKLSKLHDMPALVTSCRMMWEMGECRISAPSPIHINRTSKNVQEETWL
jgi:hypothetical protein